MITHKFSATPAQVRSRFDLDEGQKLKVGIAERDGKDLRIEVTQFMMTTMLWGIELMDKEASNANRD